MEAGWIFRGFIVQIVCREGGRSQDKCSAWVNHRFTRAREPVINELCTNRHRETLINMERNFSLILPKKDGGNEELQCKGSLLFIGANGSGKSRLGSWIDLQSSQSPKVHRISAQKSLAMPDTTTPVSIERAEKDLLFGYAEAPVGSEHSYKSGHKWRNKPVISLLNDYQKLMVYLFSDETEENAKFKASQKASKDRVEPPVTRLDLVKEVWERILPHRELVIGGLRIQTKVKGTEDQIYSSSEMSDGERVIFYLIGQCLSAPKDGIIIVDEPELHLHKSVQAPLWSEVERLRDDCLFVYLTHDVDFAAAQEGAEKIWLKSFDGHSWEWEKIQVDQDLPDDLLLEVLGNRKPVVFVEGENGSYDVSLYREILSNFLVIPRGSCTQVIQSVKALKANSQLHHLNVYGIIDRDRRVDSEILALEKDSIFVLGVAEVENLFCTKELLEILSKRLARKPEDDFSCVSRTIFGRLQSELETQVSLRVASEIKFQLNLFNEKAKGAQELNAALQALANGIDVNSLYSITDAKFNEVIANQNYEELLKLYNRKSLSTQVSGALGLSNGSLPELVIRLAKSECRTEIIDALKKYFGNFAPLIA